MAAWRGSRPRAFLHETRSEDDYRRRAGTVSIGIRIGKFWEQPGMVRGRPMIYIHSVGRAVRYYPDRPALCVGEERLSFRELHEPRQEPGCRTQPARVTDWRPAGAAPSQRTRVHRVGLCVQLARRHRRSDQYAAFGRGDRSRTRGRTSARAYTAFLLAGCRKPGCVAAGAGPRASGGLNDSCPDPCYEPEAILALIYTSGTTGRPKGVI